MSALRRGVLAVALTLAAGAGAVTSYDGIIAIVNDDVIVASELERRVEQVRAQLENAGTPAPPLQVLEKQVLERVIMDRLQLQVADQTGIRISEEQLNATISDMADSNGLTLRQFRDVLRRDGFDFALFREQIRDQLRIQQVRQRNVGDRIFVSDREVDNFLAMQDKLGAPDLEYHLGHILVATPEGASADEIRQAREEAEQVLAEVLAGEDFARLAVSHSDGQQALSGGDLGWKTARELPTIFAPIVPTMSPGDVEGPVQSANGFHLLKLVGVRGEERYIVTQTLSRHILIRPNELISDEDARVRLEQLIARVEGGEDFAALARSHSDDRATAIKGGELGWTNPGDLIPQFEEVANNLRPGEVSRPFKTQFGWHVVQVLERRQHDNTEEIARNQAREQIRARKVEEEGQAWLRQLRDSAYVEYRLDDQ